jgi:hypothetical protein
VRIAPIGGIDMCALAGDVTGKVAELRRRKESDRQGRETALPCRRTECSPTAADGSVLEWVGGAAKMGQASIKRSPAAMSVPGGVGF